MKWNYLISGLPAKPILHSQRTKEEPISSSCLGSLLERLTKYSNQETHGNRRMAKKKGKTARQKMKRSILLIARICKILIWTRGILRQNSRVKIFLNTANQPESRLSTITPHAEAFQGDLDMLVQRKSFLFW